MNHSFVGFFFQTAAYYISLQAILLVVIITLGLIKLYTECYVFYVYIKPI